MVAQDTNNNDGKGIAVDGTLAASGTNFIKRGGGVTADIQVNTGRPITANNTTFAWDTPTWNAGMNGQLAADIFSTPFAINSGTTASVTGNSFANGTVIASGDPTATINLTGNYWGTITPTQIQAKITTSHNSASDGGFRSLLAPPAFGRGHGHPGPRHTWTTTPTPPSR